MTNRLATLGLLALGLASIIGLTLLVALGHPVPNVLETLSTISVSALAGSLIPSGAVASSPSSPPSSPAPSSEAGLHIAGGTVAA